MRVLATTLACALALFSTATAGQPGQGAARGQVTDNSGGVLPGVTVVATTSDGRVLNATVTDGAGAFAFPELPAVSVRLTFQLEGFASASVALTVVPGAEARVIQRLELASLSEIVVVQGPEANAPTRLPQRPLPPILIPVPTHDRDSVCGPSKPGAFAESFGTIRSGRHDATDRLHTAGSELVIDGGLADGLEVGRNLVVRREYRLRSAGAEVVGEHSAGVLQIVSADEHSSIGVVVYACDEVRAGDFLAAFKPELLRDPDPIGTPAFHDAARILFADEGQTLGAPRRLMVIDRGTDSGAHVGQRLTLFRQRPGTPTRDIVGDAVVVAVRSDSATIRVDRVNDVISAGDWAAPQTPLVTARQPR